MKRSLPLLLLAASVLPASAHPALLHGDGAMGAVGAASAGFLHPLTGLDHLVVMVAVGLWAVQIGGRALWALPCAFVSSMIAGGLAGLTLSSWTGIAPVAEHGIVASLFLLGAALGMAWRPGLGWAVILTSLAGLCHGYAHGSEMPAGAMPLLFLAGMIAATGLLHAVGIGGGVAVRRSGTSSFPLLRASGAAILLFALYVAFFPVS